MYQEPKAKNLLTSINKDHALYNGVDFQLKKAYSLLNRPIHKNIYFISNNTVVFFIGTYVGVHHIIRDDTHYVGIDHKVCEATAFFATNEENKSKEQAIVAFAEKSIPVSQCKRLNPNAGNNFAQQNAQKSSETGNTGEESQSNTVGEGLNFDSEKETERYVT